MRLVLLLALVASGCGDDTTSLDTMDLGAGGDDLAADGRDLSFVGDMVCNGTFPGFSGVQTSLVVFACPCGCIVDSFEENFVNPNWGSSHSPSSSFAPIAGVGLGEALHFDGTSAFEYGSLYSVAPTSQFFLDGDFDLSVDYDLVSAPPGETHLLVSVRDPGTVQGIQVYELERQQGADGSNAYATMLGGVPTATVPTTATHGTLRITRAGFVYTAYGDGTKVSTLTAQKVGRVAVNITATLNGCTTSDSGATCGYEPRFHNARLASGTLVNLPQ